MKFVKILAVFGLCAALSGCYFGALGDCGWGGTISAWIDVDQNGRWDENELPLPGVIITARSGDSSPVMTGPDGRTELENWSPGCGPEGIVIEAKPPAGFRSTTRSSVSVGRERSYSFGFTYDPSVPTATPNPVALVCTSYTDKADLGDLFINDVAVTPDGDAWAATFGGLAHYDHASGAWTLLQPMQSGAETIALGPDDTLWVGTRDGVFTGKAGEKLTQMNHLVGNYVFDAVVSPGGDAWFGSDRGVTHYQPDSGQWATFADPSWALAPQQDEVGKNLVESVAVAPDGSVWAAEYFGILSHLTPGNGSPDEAKWQTYFSPSFTAQNPTLSGEPNGITLAPDGGLWLTGFSSLARLDPTTGDTRSYPLAPAWSPDLGSSTTALAFGWDGSLWIGTHGYGLVHFFPDLPDGDAGITVYTAADGLADNHVTSIEAAGDGTLWVGTFHGVSHCKPGN